MIFGGGFETNSRNDGQYDDLFDHFKENIISTHRMCCNGMSNPHPIRIHTSSPPPTNHLNQFCAGVNRNAHKTSSHVHNAKSLSLSIGHLLSAPSMAWFLFCMKMKTTQKKNKINTSLSSCSNDHVQYCTKKQLKGGGREGHLFSVRKWKKKSKNLSNLYKHGYLL